MEDHTRFHLDNLLKYSPSQWLAKQNPVVVKFIEHLTYNANENQHEGEKLFKCAVAVDIIYGIRHLKYVSAINLAASAIKYSIARSKTIIDIDNHFISSGSYTKFIKWQENLASETQPFPKGLIFMAFDNEQKGQKNYLDRGYNTVVYHTVTSFVLFNFNPADQTQNFENPWLHKTLNTLQIQELFDLTSEMQTLIDQQLHDYLSVILDETCNEKNENTNAIDNLIANQKTGKQKKCCECGKDKIENSKRKCPQCNAKLSTLAEIQQEIEQIEFGKKDSTKSLIFKSHQVKTNITERLTNPISITQRSEPQKDVNIPDMLIPDPIPINPNSIVNVRKVLDHIQEISGINKGDRKWVVVICDGIPYRYMQKFKNDYPGILLVPGPLHEEMNMLKAFVELNWYYNY